MANLAIILGKSGTGKSTSIRTLNPKTTFVINILGKRLPFKGSSKFYSEENGNIANVRTYAELSSAIAKLGAHVKTLVIDDSLFLMRKDNFDRVTESGYGKFTVMAKNFYNMMSSCKNLRNDLNVFFIMHPEEEKSGDIIAGYKISLNGKMIEQQYNPMELVPMVLFSDCIMVDNAMRYVFYTNRFDSGKGVIPAKSPMGMFDSLMIDNDLSFVEKKMAEYYDGEDPDTAHLDESEPEEEPEKEPEPKDDGQDKQITKSGIARKKIDKAKEFLDGNPVAVSFYEATYGTRAQWPNKTYISIYESLVNGKKISQVHE